MCRLDVVRVFVDMVELFIKSPQFDLDGKFFRYIQARILENYPDFFQADIYPNIDSETVRNKDESVLLCN